MHLSITFNGFQTGHSEDDPFLHLTSPYSTSLDLSNWSIYFLDTYTTMDYHVINVPAGQKGDIAFVGFATTLVILVAALYIFRALSKTATRRADLKVE
jgi:hypothetical protein